MSEQIEKQPEEVVAEKSVEEQIVEQLAEIKSVADEKLSADALEGLVKSEDLEGFVKAESVADAVEAAKSEIMDSIEEKLNALPAVSVKSNEKEDNMEFKAGLEASNGGTFGLDIPVVKAVTDTTAVTGSGTGQSPLFYNLEQMNPFRGKATIIPTTSGAVTLPESGALTVSSRSAVPATRTHEGGLTSSTVTVETWDGTAQYSIEALEDIMGLDGIVAQQAAQAVGSAERTDALSVLNASADSSASGSIQVVNTGVAANLPTAANVVGRMATLAAELSTPYHMGAEFIVDRALFGRLQESTNTTMNFDPKNGIFTLFGYPISIVDGIVAGTLGAGDQVAYFGNFGQGLALVTRESMSVRRSDEQALGSIVYYTRSRFKNAVWNADALVALNVAA